MFKKNLLIKILAIVASITSLGFGLLIYMVTYQEEKTLLEERKTASKLMAQPILHSFNQDMLKERVEMPRHLIEAMKTIKGVERVQVIRYNGIEEAFQDLKTLETVKNEYGELRPEWLTDHPNNPNNKAEGIDNPGFKKALQLFRLETIEETEYIEDTPAGRLFTYLKFIIGPEKCKACHRADGDKGILMISTSIADIDVALAASRNRWIILGFFTVLTVTIMLTILTNKIITKPVVMTVKMLQSIAEGRGDLTQRLRIDSKDEIGMLGIWFNRFIDGLQGIIKNIASVSEEVTAVTSHVKQSSDNIHKTAASQLHAVKEASSLIAAMDESISNISTDTGDLLKSTKDASDSTQAIFKTISMVAENTEKLASSVDRTAAAVEQITVNSKQITEHVDTLFEETQDTVSSSKYLIESIKNISKNAKEQAKLAEKVMSDAMNIGMSAVKKTREGMENIKKEVNESTCIIGELGNRSKEIGKIIKVINEIADTTELLAINAAILAASAGEHGKGFVVIAEEVKELASKTAVSVTEIGDIIKEVQEKVSEAVSSMERNTAKVDEGVILSANADEALNQIISSTKITLQNAQEIDKATMEQTRSMEGVTESFKRIDQMVSKIKYATNEQYSAESDISHTTEHMRDISKSVKQLIIEQAQKSKQISNVISDIVLKMETIVSTTADQKTASRKLVSLVKTIGEAADENTRRILELDSAATKLNTQSGELRNRIGNLKT